ncbi:DUF2599 domain-containing protein [Nocardia pseudobrasiliensis]|uniref:Uncharacterized protein DUF2599 n=1 Tax=Nocardia pseudobrasiliensis TaxID=45979 RepID=A0A370HYK0_9NOCA|nr:DUF2599 domain-containing protein [Nocardia pseudobrasiliensis]RDI63592.1 uncharacterized protein DUF2599 [Nocardia pseudobrasiliensis]
MRLGTLRFGAAPLLSLVVAVCGCSAADHSEPVAIGPGPTPHTTTAPAPTTATAIAATPAPTVDPFADAPLIDHTEWTDDADGRRLHVYPTAAGRADTIPAAVDRAWGEVVADAADADSPGMYDQFRCHWEWARLLRPDKPSWNLEPWRPAVGYDATVQAGCNPGGPELPGN